MLEEPHHPDVVEGLIRERKRERVGLTQRRLDAGALEIPSRKVKLLLLDVDAVELDTWELLSEHCEDCADPGADLDQPRARLELGAVADQPVPPVLGLLHEPLLLRGSVTVNVRTHARRGPSTAALT
jgi:hypothetical protein